HGAGYGGHPGPRYHAVAPRDVRLLRDPCSAHLGAALGVTPTNVASARAPDQRRAPEDRDRALSALQLWAPWLGNRYPGAPAAAVGAAAHGCGAWRAGLSRRA